MVRLFLILAILASLTACAGVSQMREEVRRSVSTAANPSVRVENTVGGVRVTVSSKHEVDVDAIKSGSSADDLRNILVDVQSQGGTVTITTKYRNFASGGVRYAISVPAGASLNVDNATGAVNVEGVEGDVTAATQTGEIVADLGRVAGRRAVDLSATTGSVRLIIDPASDATVDARSVVGDFKSDFPGLSVDRENVVGSRASGKIGGGSASIRLNTTAGAIALRRS